MNVMATKGAPLKWYLGRSVLADRSISLQSTPTRSSLRELCRTFVNRVELMMVAFRLNYRRPRGSTTQPTWGNSDIINLGAVELDGVSRFPGAMTSPKVCPLPL